MCSSDLAVYLADRRIGDETLLRNYNDSGGVMGFVEYGYYPGFASLVMGLGETGSVHVYEKFAGHTGSAGGADGEAVGKGRDALFYSTDGAVVGVADGCAIDRRHLRFMGSASRDDIGIHADLMAGPPNVI